MARADFHLHSTKSDGILTPREVVAKAAANGVTVMALTDHDTTAGVAEAAAVGEELGVRVIPGLELSADLPEGGDAHLLGYFRTIDSPRLQSQLAAFRDGRNERGQTMLAKLDALGLPLDWERVLAIAGEAAVGRPHVARAMVERGYVASVRQAFDDYLHTGGPADASREKLPPETALHLLRECGGVAVLAHPSFLPNPAAAVDRLLPAGLQGIEVYYKNYTEAQIAEFKALADAKGLFPLGGSDYHGIHDDEREPGDIPLPNDVVAAFLALADTTWAAASSERAAP
ncbi:MAG: PHP domain-containing protein [Dehalococcoidia bacterium]